MTAHDHSRLVPGCYRCELGRDEVAAQERDAQREAEHVARAFHDTYERLAPAYGYETREASRTHWALVPAENKKLMVAVARTLLDEGVITTDETQSR